MARTDEELLVTDRHGGIDGPMSRLDASVVVAEQPVAVRLARPQPALAALVAQFLQYGLGFGQVVEGPAQLPHWLQGVPQQQSQVDSLLEPVAGLGQLGQRLKRVLLPRGGFAKG